MKKRKMTAFVKELPKGSKPIVSMVHFDGRLYLATQDAVYYLSHPKTRFTRCKFIEADRKGKK